jgi:hypothetical protein
MKKRTAVLLAVLLIAIYGMMHMMPLLFGRPLFVFDMDMPRHYGPFAGHPHFAFQGPRDHMMMFNGWMMFRIFPFLFHLTLLLSGWIWWKRKSPLQWLGLALMAWGLIGLLPKWLLVPLAFGAAYLLAKRQQTQTGPIGTWPAPHIQTAHILDEWEKNIKKEDQ